MGRGINCHQGVRSKAREVRAKYACLKPLFFLRNSVHVISTLWEGGKWCILLKMLIQGLKKALHYLSELGMSRKLHMQLKDAIIIIFIAPLSGKDLLAVLSPGFGKSLIFQMWV